MKSPCQTAITNLKTYYEKCSDPTSSKEELVAIHDTLYDKKYEVMFNGKRYNYKYMLQYVLTRDDNSLNYQYSNVEAEVLDNITFHYTYDFHQKGLPQKSYTMHYMATVNPNNGKIISRKIMTGQSINEIIEAFKTSSASTRNHNATNKSVGNVPSSASPAGLMNTNYNKRRRNSRHLVSRILKRSSTMTTRISTILSGEN
mmetsp:Transcript_26388/g.29622  ORF Transcript_26388/g.29622 Transcript_26388/m.29622 type:complete len:201 (-) Transcript_26388:112-714(-)